MLLGDMDKNVAVDEWFFHHAGAAGVSAHEFLQGKIGMHPFFRQYTLHELLALGAGVDGEPAGLGFVEVGDDGGHKIGAGVRRGKETTGLRTSGGMKEN